MSQDKTLVRYEGVPDAALAYVVSSRSTGQPLLVVARDMDAAQALHRDFVAWGARSCFLFPGENHAPHEQVSADPTDVAARLAVRHAIVNGDAPRIIVAPATALLLRWLPEEAFTRASQLYVKGEEIERDEVAAALVRCGYQRVNLVEDEGTFAIRGGIIDVFAPGSAYPVRIDLFGDEIASIKNFDPASQRTFAPQESWAMHPIREVVFDDASVAQAQESLRSYGEDVTIPTRVLRQVMDEVASRNYFFGVEAMWPAFYASSEPVLATLLRHKPLVVLQDAGLFDESLGDYWKHAEGEADKARGRHQVVLPLERLLESSEAVRAALAEQSRWEFRQVADDRLEKSKRLQLDDWRVLAAEMQIRRQTSGRGDILEPLMTALADKLGRGYDVVLACATRGSAERLRDLLRARKMDLPITEKVPSPPDLGPREVDGRRSIPRRVLVVAPFAAGFVDLERKVAVFSDTELLGTVAPSGSRRKRAKPKAEGLSTLQDLRPGDFVIHVDHGVGQYQGLSRLILNGVDGDYVHLVYLGGDKLYLPVYRLGLLQRYRGSADSAKLDKLGSTRWENAKARVKDAVLALAHELLATQAKRKSVPGFALPSPDETYRAFEATFPYEETPDQQKAIDDVLGDLVKESPMDRLVCGDVGFGKTEVAVRGTFLAVMGKKQVAVLVPTTVLAEQHGVTFRERLAPQGVSVEVVSRFRSAAENKEILDRLKDGSLDVIVGTHRLLSSDVVFKDLGLLVVDEEHRFGVKHKERIKQMKSSVHVLTLTATPIPRTMHMAMMGLRDLSIISTPPTQRVSVRTEVTRFDEPVIAEAIKRELHRGGQVFVVHNRVRSIGAMTEMVRELVPEAKVGFAHGQMSGEELEGIMVQFVRRELHVLVCTAIIESGIDIPSANTMIINRADTFGLAQLHQLRGRIGRGTERAFAYLLLPRSEKVTREASERLSVLKRFSELGSGFSLATFDLDLRGAGDLLGPDQSGSIAAVGFDLYSELLKEAVEQVKGQKHGAHIEPEIKLPVAAVIPEAYVPEPMQRLAYYQRLTQATSDDEVFRVAGEVADVYGDPPEELGNLVETLLIRRKLMAMQATHLSGDVVKGELKIGLMFTPEAPLERATLTSRLQSQPDRYRILPSGRLLLTGKAPSADAGGRVLLQGVRDLLALVPTTLRAT